MNFQNFFKIGFLMAPPTRGGCFSVVFFPVFMMLLKNGFAEDVKCYSCSAPLGTSMTFICHPNGTNLDYPTNEEIKTCPNGCFEKVNRNGTDITIERGCNDWKLPHSCWGGPVEKCTSVGDALYTCSCGTNLCNKNMNCTWNATTALSTTSTRSPIRSSASFKKPPGIYITFSTTTFLISATASFYDASCYYYCRFVKDSILLMYLLIFFSLQADFFPYRPAVVYSLL